MRTNHYEDDLDTTAKSKSKIIGTIIKIIAVVLIIVSIILLLFGLMPHERVSVKNKTLEGGYVGCYSGISADKGDILIIDFVVEGSDVAFYLTYGQAWCEGNHDALEQKDHVRDGHLEINIEKTGYYYLNFESNDPSSSTSFNVDLSYKIMDRYSPLHIVLGMASLGGGLILTIIYTWVRKKPAVLEPEYIRL